MELRESAVFYTPNITSFVQDDIYYFIDGDSPNWFSTDLRGSRIFKLLEEKNSVGDVIRAYGKEFHYDVSKAWLHVHDFVQSALHQQMISREPFPRSPYGGRSEYLKPSRLNEFWVHTNNSCNLTCTHCLVSSHPGGDPGLSTDALLRILDEAHDLGVYRYYFTGGEPFLRKDIYELVDDVTRKKKAELIILTNATLFQEGKLDRLKKVDRERLFLQVSLDGSTSGYNDSIRGKGTFQRIVEGLRLVGEMGFRTSLTAVVTRENLKDIPHLPALARELSVRSLHLMWPHRRGRLAEGGNGHFPEATELLELSRTVKRRSESVALQFDNFESYKLRVNAQPGTKFDLSNACWDSLCLYSDGLLYPSASFANHPPLKLGDARAQSLKDLWLNSPVARTFRASSLIQKPGIGKSPFRFFTGGGDIEHSFFFSERGAEGGSILAEDPYGPLYEGMVKDAMIDLSEKKRASFNSRSGYEAPVLYHGMGQGALECGTTGIELLTEEKVYTLHSNCVLSFDVEKSHRMVQRFYGKAAEKPQPELCCPVRYGDDDVGHIPEEVLQRFYGCGSPVTLAGIKAGEWILDLGSGGGIDCFIAARKVGPTGKVIGIDMTEEMLEIARRNKPKVSENLGFDVVEFQKGYLEKIPVKDHTVDLITSNCVINLSPDKAKVFSEMWRVLKDHGRIVVSDIVSEQPVPSHIRLNEQLWGECISGALTEGAFLSGLEKAGFYGIHMLKKDYWKEIEGYPFYSVTVTGYKFEKKEGCLFHGHRALYRGPFKSVIDEEGHIFPRNEMVEVCTDTVSKLSKAPYASCFTIIDPDGKIAEVPPPPGGCLPEEERGKCC